MVALAYPDLIIESEKVKDAKIKDLREDPKPLPAQLKKIFKEDYADGMRADLAPIFHLSRGMHEQYLQCKDKSGSASSLDGINAFQLSTLIQGETVTAKGFIELLEFETDYMKATPNQQKWLKQWINEAAKSDEKDKLRNLLFAITGSYSLGSNKIKIYKSKKGIKVAMFGTCSNELALPIAPNNYDKFKESLDTSILNAISKYGRYAKF